MQGGFNFGATPQGAPGAFGFGSTPQQQQQNPGFGAPQQQSAPSFGFGQPSSTPFGQPAQAQPPAFGASAAPSPFGQPQQPLSGFGSPAAVAPLGFGGQPQQQQQPAFGTASFGGNNGPPPLAPAAAVGGFGGIQQQPAPSSSFGFGSAAPTPVAPSNFSFGAAVAPVQTSFTQQQQQQPPSQPPTLSSAPVKFDFGAGMKKSPFQRQQRKLEDVDEDVFDYEAEKRKALAAMPTFAGSGGGGFKPPPGLQKSSQQQQQSGSRGGGINTLDVDPIESARRNQRAARFAPVTTNLASNAPPPSVAPPAATPFSSSKKTASFNSFGAGDASGMDDEEEGFDGGLPNKTAIVGTCEEMCPAIERQRRQNMNDIQMFERVDPANASLTSPELAVKRFARTVDDPHPSEFRTRSGLKLTMDYLRGLLDRKDAHFRLVHKFLWDRYRSVRQDLYIQGIQDAYAVGIYEEIVRFHVLCEHELCAEDQTVTDMEGFNSHLNVEQMNKSLISLNEMYKNLASSGQPMQSEPEFRAYHMMSLMGEHGKYKGDQQAFLSTLQTMRPEVRTSPAIQWVLELQRAFAANNFVKFFNLVRGAPYLLACMAQSYFPIARKRALLALTDACSTSSTQPKAMELHWLQDILMMDSLDEVRQLCTQHELNTGIENGIPVVYLVKGATAQPPAPLARTPCASITMSALPTRGECVTTPFGATMGYTLLDSQLTPEEIAAMEARRVEALRAQQEVAEKARLAAQAEAAKLRQAELERQAAAEKARREEEERRLREEAEKQRIEKERLDAIQRQKEEEARQAEMIRQEEARRKAAEEEAHRKAAEAARRAEEERRRAAAEAEARRKEEERQRKLREEAERRRLAELERQRLEEIRRQEEERKRLAEEARIRSIQRKYFAFWFVNARRRLAVRQRQQRIAASLKACRVGASVPLKGLTAEELAQVEEDFYDMELLDNDSTSTRGPLDLAAIAAPLLLQLNPDAKNLLWKLALLQSNNNSNKNNTSTLYSWLQVELSKGRPVATSTETSYIDGPLELQVSDDKTASLATCISMPRGATTAAAQLGFSSAALAGAAGVVLAVEDGDYNDAIVSSLIEALPSTPSLPVLIITETEKGAREFQQSASGRRLVDSSIVHKIVSLITTSTTTTSKSGVGSYKEVECRHQLTQGLIWLATNAPQQPLLVVVQLEDVARDAVSTVTSSIIAQEEFFRVEAAPSDVVAAFNQAISIVEEAIQAASTSSVAVWRWPPSEICAAPLQHWYDLECARELIEALEGVKLPPTAALVLNPTLSASQVAAQLQLRLAGLASSGKEKPLPLVVFTSSGMDIFTQKIQDLAASKSPSRSNRVRLLLQGPEVDGTTRSSSSSRSASPLRQKRKWDEEIQVGPARAIQAAAAHDRLKSGLAVLQSKMDAERNVEQHFQASVLEAIGGVDDTTLVNSSAEQQAAINESEQEEDGGTGVESSVLRRLNRQVENEKAASNSLWSRLRSAATSMF